MKRAWPIRWFLYALVAAAAVPLCVYVGGMLAREIDDAEDQAEQLAMAIASSAASRTRSKIRDIEVVARAFAERPLVRALDPARCDPLFESVLPLFPVHLNVSLVDLDRQFLCSALPPPPSTSMLPLHAALPIAFAGAFGVSEPLVGVLPAKFMVSVAYPVRNAEGRIGGALTMPVDLAALKPVDDGLALPEGTIVRVTDGSGVVVASSVTDDPELGRSLLGTVLGDTMFGPQRKVFRMDDGHGVVRVYAQAPVGVRQWRAYAGVPVARLYARAWARAATGALAAGAILVVSMLGAALVARSITRPAQAIQNAMDEIAAGRDTHAVPSGPSEIRGLAENFNRMLDARVRAERLMRENEARLRLAVSASSIGLWDWDVQRNVVYLSAEWKRQLGYEPDELADRYSEWESRLHPEERERVLAALAGFLQSDRLRFDCEYRLRHRDGSYRWVHSLAEVTRADDGTPVRMVGTHVDITARKTMERELQYAVAQLRGLTSRLMVVEENERRSIGRELHDRVGANLAALHISLRLLSDTLEGAGGAGAMPLLDDAREVLSVTSAEIRSIIADLRPPALDDFGIYAAIRAHAAAVAARLGIELTLSFAEGLPRPRPAVETTLFRIAQEALTNMAKHASATRVEIGAESHDGKLTLTIADDGVGFAPGAIGSGAGEGMQIMRERADAIEAAFEVVSAPGAGTRVAITVSL